MGWVQHVVGGVDADHHTVQQAGFRSLEGHGGVVAADAQMTDHTLPLQGEGVGHNRAVQDLQQILPAVHHVDQAKINEVCFQPLQQILKGAAGLVDVQGAAILTVLPDRAQMSLDHHPLSVPRKGQTQIGAHLRLGHKAVKNIDAGLHGRLHHLHHGGGILPL